ncbi:hypothetical protein [Kangiella sp.]|uniref:hypothetical protein n=1 Tax=Kangiella sp. TaxID=1920245 RepID=UPI001984E9CA|nr:hypothetical protein [Kangiella sp.]MBD3654020.1 hypothetical protein [Kangiella sp.]
MSCKTLSIVLIGVLLTLTSCSNYISVYEFKTGNKAIDSLKFSKDYLASVNQLEEVESVLYCNPSSKFHCLVAQGNGINLSLPKIYNQQDRWVFYGGTYTYAKTDNQFVQKFPDSFIDDEYDYILEHDSELGTVERIYAIDNKRSELLAVVFVYQNTRFHFYELAADKGLTYATRENSSTLELSEEPVMLEP